MNNRTKFLHLALAASFSASVSLANMPYMASAANEEDTKNAKPGTQIKLDVPDELKAAREALTKPQAETAKTGASAEDKAETETKTSSKEVSTADDSEDPAKAAVAGTAVSKEGNIALEHYDQARHYFSKWQFPMAEIELEVALMYAPGLKIAHRDYSIVSMLQGHPIRSFAEALMTVGICESVPLSEAEREQLTQRASKVHYSRALFHARKNEWDNAIAELNWAKTYTPQKPAILRSLAFCYASKGEFNLAEQQYNQCFQIDPDDAFTHADFSQLLAQHGQQERAQGQLTEALKIAPQVAALHVDMGWLAETKGDYHTAQSEFEEAIKLCPKQPGLWLQLGKVLERAGKASEAKHAYTQVLAIDSSEDEAKQRLEALTRPDDKAKLESQKIKS